MKSCCKEAMENKQSQEEKKPNGAVTWLKRLGLAGFLFFLIKGILWLVVLYGGIAHIRL